METDYRDLLIELLLDKMHTELIKKPQAVANNATVTPIRKEKKHRRKTYPDQHKWTIDEYKFIADAVRADYSTTQIAELMGLRVGQVNMAIYRIKTGAYNAPILLADVK
jgi:hypothetical protein